MAYKDAKDSKKVELHLKEITFHIISNVLLKLID